MDNDFVKALILLVVSIILLIIGFYNQKPPEIEAGLAFNWGLMTVGILGIIGSLIVFIRLLF